MKNKNNNSFEDNETLKKFNNNLINKHKRNFNCFNLIFIIAFNILVIIVILNIKKNIEHLEISFNNKIKNLDEDIKNQDNTIKYQETQIKNQDNIIKNQENLIKNLDYKNLILNQQIEAFFSYFNCIKNESCIYQLLRPKEVLGKHKVRIGSNNDGGYILLNDFENIKIAYSFGIGNEISFDKELADKNIDIFMYDHTIEALPFTNPKFHWNKIGISYKKEENNSTKTFNEILEENGHTKEKDMILKLDIEGGEWNILYELNQDILTQFKYIIIEFHFEDIFASKYQDIFKKLNQTHQIFHLHCNNCCPIINFDGYNLCSSLEISFIIREKNTFIDYFEYFPLKNLDFKNVENMEDINFFLNFYQFDKYIGLLKNLMHPY